MIFGSADSDDDVPSTIRISSLMYFRNLIRLKPVTRAMPPRMTKTNSRQVTYMPAINCPSERRLPTPYRPTVNAMAPKAPIGARRITIPTMANRARELIDDGDDGRDDRAERQRRETEEHGEEQHLQDLAARERVDDGVRDDVQQEVGGGQRLRRGGVARDRLHVERRGSIVRPLPGWRMFTTTIPRISAIVDTTSK